MIVERMIELKEQKKQLFKLSDKANTLSDMERKLQFAETQLSQKQQELDQLRKGAGF